MGDIDRRSLFISDDEWNRTSPSWKQLKPLRNFNEFSIEDESVDQCFKRLKDEGFRIPHLVIEQLIYPLYYNRHVIKNYGWIDYKKAIFIDEFISIEELETIYVIKEYRKYVESRSTAKPYEDFMCKAQDIVHWKNYSTWRIPPVVLDVTSFPDAPMHAELGGKLQLIEGHTRLGYLLAMKNANMLFTHEHKVFLLKAEL